MVYSSVTLSLLIFIFLSNWQQLATWKSSSIKTDVLYKECYLGLHEHVHIMLTKRIFLEVSDTLSYIICNCCGTQTLAGKTNQLLFEL